MICPCCRKRNIALIHYCLDSEGKGLEACYHCILRYKLKELGYERIPKQSRAENIRQSKASIVYSDKIKGASCQLNEF